MATVPKQVFGDTVLGLALLALGACGSVTASEADGAAGARGDAAGELSGAAGMTGAAGTAAGAGGTGVAADAAVEQGRDAGPPVCEGTKATVTATKCKDIDGVRCAADCQSDNASAPPYVFPCTQAGPPWTGGIPVLCVKSCADCP
jgi:hypothetical protein